MRKSIVDSANPVRLAALVHKQMDRIDELEKEATRNTWLLAEVCCHLNIAVCDFCGNEWFTCRPVQGLGPRGDVRGLLVNGGACCTKCLDKLYQKTVDFDQEELDECYRDVARWMLRCRPAAQWTLFGRDEIVQHLMKQFSP